MAEEIRARHFAATDLFVVPTIGLNPLYALIIVRLVRRELFWVNVTAHPTAEWIARQITEAFPWNEAPRYPDCRRSPSKACCHKTMDMRIWSHRAWSE